MTAATPTDIAEVANKAADYIEEHGHVHNTFHDNEGRVCVLGAVNAAAANLSSYSAYIPYLHAIASVVPDDLTTTACDDFDRVTFWNDRKDNSGRYLTTKREAVRLLRRVAKKHGAK